MKKTLFKFTGFILLAFITLNSCSQNVNTAVKNSEDTLTYKYNPELDITFESFEQEGLEYFTEKEKAARAASSRAASIGDAITDGTAGAFASAVGSFLQKKLNDAGTNLLTMGYQYLVTDIGGELLSTVGKLVITEIVGEKSAIVKFLYPEKPEEQDTYGQILALAESQVILNAKLDKIYNAIVLTNLNNCLNSKKTAYNAIQLHDTKTSNLIDSLRASYKDVMENGTEEDKAAATEIINKQMNKILAGWGEEQVNGQRHCTNAMIMMTNYMTEFSCAPEPNMTYVDMYDFIASKIYGWEAEGYEMRELLRTLDKAVITQDVTLAVLYYQSIGASESAKALQKKYEELMTFYETKKINFDYDHVICQIENVNKKFKSELGIKTSADYYDAIYTYRWGWDRAYRARLDFNKWAVANRVRFGIHWDDENWDNWQQPALLSMKDYQNIVNFYDNKLTLREIFQDHAHFDKANQLLKNYGGRESKDGIHSFILNDANSKEWWDESGASDGWREYIYYSVTDMNSTNLPTQNPDWNSKYHSERDYKFFYNLVLETHDSGLRSNGGIPPTLGNSYVVCWPVLEE